MKISYQKIWIKFHGRLSKFLPSKSRKFILHQFIDQTSVKDLIESFNIPHTEVDVILVNKKSVTFDYLIQNGDRIEVFPDKTKILKKRIKSLKPKIKGEPKFIADVHLGGLVKLMRMLGLDVLYNNNYTDEEIIEVSEKENRIILTRDVGILKRKSVNLGHYVFETVPEKQLKELLKCFNLKRFIKPFSRCLNCGTILKRISRKKVFERLKDFKFEKGMLFYYCIHCDKIYWEGSHYDKMKKKIKSLKISLGGDFPELNSKKST